VPSTAASTFAYGPETSRRTSSSGSRVPEKHFSALGLASERSRGTARDLPIVELALPEQSLEEPAFREHVEHRELGAGLAGELRGA
jgi:hypothetical protein